MPSLNILELVIQMASIKNLKLAANPKTPLRIIILQREFWNMLGALLKDLIDETDECIIDYKNEIKRYEQVH